MVSLPIRMYSETCPNKDHLYPGTTSLLRPLGRVKIVLVQLISTSVMRTPPYLLRPVYCSSEVVAIDTFHCAI